MADVLEELESLLPELPMALERRSLGESLARVALLLNDITAATQRLSDICEISDIISFGEVPEVVEKMDDLIEEAAQLASLLMNANDAASLHQIERDLPHFKSTIGGALGAIKQRWRTQVATDYRPFLSLGQLLSKIDHGNCLGVRMVKLAEDANASLSVMQADQFKLAVARLIDTRALLESEKTSFTADEQVDHFLTGLAQGQAKLRSVSPDVFRWLSEHDALDLFEVRPIA
ncbi:hypothetical protein HJC06_13930 [Rhizobium sp. NLR9b]|uniref:hypothetical protein n=1 Tax=unclassified Rhizobium TaxID=2613769 RepID=UPI001C82B4DE|nr:MULTISPECIES: hypothetical protein [unclassified Rhizobium]MBX5227513.1 hypothetical protein [Rhizobium sp. NLR9b]MBX5288557.1 hypothetical protein [Rhizobium sp. NLR10b]